MSDSELRAITRSDLIASLSRRSPQFTSRDVESAVKTVLEHITETLSQGGRVEIRGFGSFSLRFRQPRIGRNPRSGAPVELGGRHILHFKPGKEMRERVDSKGSDAD